MPIKNTLLSLSLSLALAVTAPAVAREEAPIIYSNMTTTQMSALLQNVGFVGMFDWLDKNDKHRGSVYYRWSAGGGVVYSCRFNTEYRQYKSIKFKEWPDIQKSRAFRTKYPVWIGKVKSGHKGYASLRYSPDDGGLNYYSYYKLSKDWKSTRVGHLQKRIPAVVYQLCPKFPSAKSLGAEINHKQTSDNYFELLKQDKGDRIKRPDLVTEDPVERY